ncbi:MAG: SUA5-like translation factor [Chlorobi bacterium OLB5]|nr:MAG: SUA5-like translation factor [Chlorobi bacterium OLB5]
MKTTVTNNPKIAAAFIKAGEIAAFPTETVYGLGADAYNEKAVKKIFKAKGRPVDNPLIVHIANKKDINVLAQEITPSAKKIISKFFPGPVTVILKKNEIIPPATTAGLDTIAIRMPAGRLAQQLIKAAGVPIAAPSANLSGSPSPTNFLHVLRDFNNKIPCLLIGPPAKYGLESTVIDCTGKNPVILRPGSVTLEQIKKLDKNAVIQKKGGKIKSPGQKYKHYSPKADVRIINVKREMSNVKRNEAFIGLDRNLGKGFEKVLICRSMNDYARKLFSFFRECDDEGIKTIWCQKVAEKGIGAAIMNRLNKAIH